MIHLSARLAWHDSGWNGCVCKSPHLNAYCIANETIRDERDDELERKYCGTLVNELKEWMPPCSRDIVTYSPIGYRAVHKDPLYRSFLKPITEEVTGYTVLPAPYRWLREENFQDICENEGLIIRMGDNPSREYGWVYEPDRQIELLENFWGKLKGGEGNSLIFYYSKENPVDEESLRLLVGIGRILEIGPQLFFDGQDKEGRKYPIWTRTITQDYPNQGFRLPYQEYLSLGEDPKEIACYIPPESIPAFSFVGEHVSDDQAIGIIERAIQSVEKVIEQDKVPGPWKTQLSWLNECLEEVWIGRGPFPGIPSVLRFLGFSNSTIFHRKVLFPMIKNRQDPWSYVKRILNREIDPPFAYNKTFEETRFRWRVYENKQSKLDLIDKLVRFELTPDQVKRVLDRDERENAGILANEEELSHNPYILCERDLGTATSDPISLETIDRGMIPEGDSNLFIPQDERIMQDDIRRVRAVAVNVLNDSANCGDELLTLKELLDKIRTRFPERRACRPEREFIESNADYYNELLWFAFNNDPQLVTLRNLRSYEEIIADTIANRVKRINKPPDPPIDWYQSLINEFGCPNSEREKAALEEKAKALEILFSQRVSVLTGSAGTGKTSALKVFLNCLEESEGQLSARLLAPTGKARVRLSTSTGRNAFTIHQLLLKLGWFLPDIFILKPQGGGTVSPNTVIIDECSMVPMDLMGTLFKAINMGMVQRLILVGDPNQLPPIGPGRPFVDIINWLKENHPQCIATLRTTMRTADDSDIPVGKSVALAFADGYRADIINPSDDEILSEISQGKSSSDLEILFWKDQDELKHQLDGCMNKLGIGKAGDFKSFNNSFEISEKPNNQLSWRGAESWQILSPLRGRGYGTEDLNRMIQFAYKMGLIKKAQFDKVKPFGDQQIVFTDKVIQIRNQRRYAWPREKGLDYVANGEIGIVTTTGSNENGVFLQIGFSTQDGVTYRYYRNEVENSIELAYALTVHKAQGSDFEIVFLILPKEARTMSRELIYTGLTRFRKKLVLLIEGDTEVLTSLRLSEHSDTHLRNTNLFSLEIRPDDPKVIYPSLLIHRTSTGVAVRSKSEVIVADTLTRLGLEWEYERKLINPKNPGDFRLPDFTVGYQGDLIYWEHLGMLASPLYREGWERKRKWYQEILGIPVIGDGAPDEKLDPGVFPLVITSADNEDGGIDVPRFESLIKKFILLQD